MNNIYAFIKKVKQTFEGSQYPFLQKQLQRVQTSQPYKGLRVLHHIPFTKETILKLEILYAGGAEVVVSSPSFMAVDEQLKADFIQAGGTWMDLAVLEGQMFDIGLDCAAELLGVLQPRIGTVEITGTGTNKYQDAALDYPVISVDQSKIKYLEGVLGTGEAFVRAFRELTQENIDNQKIMIFGYGKVGRGIAYHLQPYTNQVIVVDKNQEKLQQALEAGYEVILADNASKVEAAASNAFAIVTATGIENVISDHYNKKAFTANYLANMGGDDEFGYQFDAKEVMCQKRPINFFIEKPTLMRYLDPVFYAHNLGIDLLLYANLSKGLHPFPSFLAEEITAEWTSIFKEKDSV